MAAWAGYVVWLLIPWAKTAWSHFNEGGLWITKPKPAVAAAPVPASEAVTEPTPAPDAPGP
jgi:hypothetical protein